MSECLFCRSKINNCTKPEHIIPESLGNDTYILPIGVVCDKCNQYFSKLDEYFCHNHLASATKLLYLDKTKKGKLPYLPLQDGEARRSGDNNITFSESYSKNAGKGRFSMTFFANEMVIQGTIPLPDSDSKKISRFLSKCGVEILHLKKGKLAFGKDFDHVRRYARYGGKNIFVPFLWGRQFERFIELYLCEADCKEKGMFYFGTVFLPGVVYYIPLNRIEEKYVFNILAENNPLNVCDKECLIKRDPITYKMEYGPPQ